MGGGFEVIKALVAAWRDGNRGERVVIVVSVAFMLVGLTVFLTGNLVWFSRWFYYIAVGVGLGGFSSLVVVVTIQESRVAVQREKRIEAVEQRVQDDPKATQAAWELARVKLENYLDRNLSQVRSIYWLTLMVMAVGFALISYGVYQGFQVPAQFKASLLSAVSGVIVSFVGGTFLIVYRATMAQAKDLVTVLERINAVGMSVQILESIDDGATDLKNKTTAELAMQLLAMYSTADDGVPNPGFQQSIRRR